MPPAPRRVQLRRSKGWRKPEGTVVVARPSKWGNPVKVDPSGRAPGSVRTFAEAVARYRDGVERPGRPDFPSIDEIRAELRGRDLACWCPPDRPCHADVLLEIANS